MYALQESDDKLKYVSIENQKLISTAHLTSWIVVTERWQKMTEHQVSI